MLRCFIPLLVPTHERTLTQTYVDCQSKHQKLRCINMQNPGGLLRNFKVRVRTWGTYYQVRVCTYERERR